MPRRFTIGRLLGLSGGGPDDPWASESFLPQHRDHIVALITPEEVTKIALRLRHLIEECVPCELEESLVTQAHSRVITTKVIKAAKEAGGEENRACVVFCLLVCCGWFKRQAHLELWHADFHHVRSTACEVIAKAIIEDEDNTAYLLHSVLLHRFSMIANGGPTYPTNVIEKAVDLHALRVICCSGYQMCLKYLWKGWVCQDEGDPTVFVDYTGRDDRRFIVHMDPDRIRAPVYRNMVRLIMSLIYLALYTIAINSINPRGELGGAEILLYIFNLGFVCDEFRKFSKAGYNILSFLTAFNGTLYTAITVSFVLRMIGLGYSQDTENDWRIYYNRLSYNFLAFSAPIFWTRLLLYLDSFRFFGAMLVVLKVMMMESIIFFALLAVIVIGFLQAFISLDLADNLVVNDIWFVISAMANSAMQSPDFDSFKWFAPPFGIILYYIFTFIVEVILLNILIALYGSAYKDIYQNADNEFMALFAQKTMQLVRAPDKNVYIAPFNLLEMAIVVLFQWWMPKPQYELLNDIAMAIIYSPLLVVSAIFETRAAHDIRLNRSRGDEDHDTVEVWEQMEDSVDFEVEGWAKVCAEVKSNVEEESAVLEVRRLRGDVEELKSMISDIARVVGKGGEGSSYV